MRVFPKKKWRILLSVAVPVLLSFLIHPPRWWAIEIRSHTAFLWHSRVTDKIDTLSFWDEWWFERNLQQIADESGVDIRFMLVPNTEGKSLEAYSIERARTLGVGRDAGRRGLLFVYDASAQHLRLEVGAKLEGVITDAFAGYLMRNHVRSFFGAGNPRIGLFTTLMVVHHRLREGVLGKEFDPKTLEFIEDARRLAVGGGASAVVQSGAKPFLNNIRPSSPAVRRHFGPQPTPEAAYHRYLEWIAGGGYATDVPLFTSLSQGYLGSLTMTRGFNEFLFFSEYNSPYRIEVRDSLALLYFTSSPLVGPHFLRRSSQGWVLDIYAEILNTRNYTGEPYAWGMVESGDDFTTTFADRFIEVGPILRLRDGDNRPLQSRVNHDIPKADSEPPGPALEQLTVAQAAQRIEAQSGDRPLMVILYQTRGRSARSELPFLVALAEACGEAGGKVLAFSVDDRPPQVRKLSSFLREHRAGFPATRIYPWPKGQLIQSMAPLGIRIGTMWLNPLVAVRKGGVVTVQADGFAEVDGMSDRLLEACTGTETKLSAH